MMKVVVTELPSTPRDCLFSKLDPSGQFYVCGLRGYIPKADKEDIGYKPECICRNTKLCSHLDLEF